VRRAPHCRGRWVARPARASGRHRIHARGYLASLRQGLQLPRGRVLPVPMPLVRLAATIGAKMPGALLDNDSVAMLERGNVASVDDTQRLLGRVPREPAAFIDPREAAGMRLRAQLGWLLPTLRLSVAALWIVTGIVSLGLYPVEHSLALLARVGITGALAPVALYGAAALDLGLGVATLAMSRRRALWLVQIAVIAGYTLIITAFLPEFWLHPFQPEARAGRHKPQRLDRLVRTAVVCPPSFHISVGG